MEDLSNVMLELYQEDKVSFFATFTNGIGEVVLEDGLCVDSDDMQRYFYPLNLLDISNIEDFVLKNQELGDTCLILGMYPEECETLDGVANEMSDSEKWAYEDATGVIATHAISPDSFLGYIDTNHMDFVHNSKSKFSCNYYSL